LLWIILVLATAVVVFTITYKLGVIRDVIPETHADLISVVSLLFFLIVLILYVPTTGKKRKKTRMVEVTPISNSEEIVFSQITEEDEEDLDDHYRSGESTDSPACAATLGEHVVKPTGIYGTKWTSSTSIHVDSSALSISQGKSTGMSAASSSPPCIDESEILEFRFPFHPEKEVYAETTINVGKGRSLTLLCEMT